MHKTPKHIAHTVIFAVVKIGMPWFHRLRKFLLRNVVTLKLKSLKMTSFGPPHCTTKSSSGGQKVEYKNISLRMGLLSSSFSPRISVDLKNRVTEGEIENFHQLVHSLNASTIEGWARSKSRAKKCLHVGGGNQAGEPSSAAFQNREQTAWWEAEQLDLTQHSGVRRRCRKQRFSLLPDLVL